MSFRRHLIYGVMVCAWLSTGAARSQDDSFIETKSGKAFPNKVTFTLEGKEFMLAATGATHFVKESKKATEGKENAQYTMAHYMEAATKEAEATWYGVILEKPAVKQMVFSYEADITGEALKKIYTRFFSKVVSPDELGKNKAAIDEFLAAMNAPIAAKQQFAFRWLPDNRMVIILPAQEKILSASPIASWFWKSWFGDASPLDRAALIAKLTQ